MPPKSTKQGTRSQRMIQIELPTPNDKICFQKYCNDHGQTPMKVMRKLIELYVKGEIDLSKKW